MSKGLGKIQSRILDQLADDGQYHSEPGEWLTGLPVPESHKYGHTDEAKARCAECQAHYLTSWGSGARVLAFELFYRGAGTGATPAQHSAVRRALRGLVARGLAETKAYRFGYSGWNEYRITAAGQRVASSQQGGS
jgi:hypothetical protein